MFWELIQQGQISQANWAAEDAKSAATDARSETRYLKTHIQRLEERVERISLAAMAVAEILREKLGVPQSEIDAKIQEIDLRDGKPDGRLSPPTNHCHHCNHTNAPHRRACLYCGETLPNSTSL